jgi:hypothetical protein
MSSRAHLLIACAALAASACQRRSVESAPDPSVAAVHAAPPPTPARLPEDAEAGARSVAQWREHLEEEERERKLRYDRRKLSQHRRVSQVLRTTQGQLDHAPSRRAVEAAQRSFRASLPTLEKAFDSIDHYGDSSRLLTEYRKLSAIFSETYPEARIAALAGSMQSLQELEARVATHFQTIEEWLREASRPTEE